MTVSKAIEAMTTSVSPTHESSPSPQRFISIYDSFLLIASTPGFTIEIFSEAWNVRSPSLSLMLYADEETDQLKDPFLWLQRDPVGRTLTPSEAIRYGQTIYLAGVLAEKLSGWMGQQSEVTEAALFEWATDHLGSEITPEQLARIRHTGTPEGITTTLYWTPEGIEKTLMRASVGIPMVGRVVKDTHHLGFGEVIAFNPSSLRMHIEFEDGTVLRCVHLKVLHAMDSGLSFV